MAKGNMLLGYARGKVGSLVFARRKGEQITRARNFAPTNPRTNAQMSQRMKMYAPVQLYRQSMRRFFKFAFNVAAHETIFNAYMRENIGIAPWVSKELSVAQAPVPFPAKMSSGGVVGFKEASDISELTVYGLQSIVSGTDTGYGVYTKVDSDAGITIGDISQGLLDANPSLQVGDQITFVVCRTEGLQVERGNVVYNGVSPFEFNYAKFVLDPNSTKYPGQVGLTTIEREGVSDGEFLGLHFDGEGVEACVGGCIIVTRNDGSSVIASNTVLQLNDSAKTVYNTMRTDAYREKASLSYKVTPDAYLNPATTEA